MIDNFNSMKRTRLPEIYWDTTPKEQAACKTLY